MKKEKFLLSVIFALFFGLSNISSADEAYIASFNILRLGAVKKDIPQTAKLLQGFDIVGLVEVINRDGVEELVDELNKQGNEKWDYHISPFGVGSSKYKEYFAYVYKKDKVKNNTDIIDNRNFLFFIYYTPYNNKIYRDIILCFYYF